MQARVINPPLTQYMLCSPSEGAAAVVLARSDRAADICERPVRLAAVAKRTRRFGSFEVFAPWLPPEAGHSPSVDAARAVFAAAGIAPSDVQVAQLQDTDAGAEIYHMAETGLCEDGAQQHLIDLTETAPTAGCRSTPTAAAWPTASRWARPGCGRSSTSSSSCRDEPVPARCPGSRRSVSRTFTARPASARARY